MNPAETESVQRLEEALRTASESRRRARWYSRLGTLATLVVFCGLVFLLYGSMKERYSWKRLEEPVRIETERLTPLVHESLRAVAMEAGPVYGRLAQERLEAALPILRTSVQKEWEILADRMATKAEPEVTAAVERIADRQWKRVVSHYPHLDNEAGRVAIAEKWKDVLDQEHAKLFADFDLKVGGDLITLSNTIEGFRPNRFEVWDEEPLTRHFVHLWLMLLDRQVLGLDEPAEVSHDE
jgi:hypothetical protein